MVRLNLTVTAPFVVMMPFRFIANAHRPQRHEIILLHNQPLKRKESLSIASLTVLAPIALEGL